MSTEPSQRDAVASAAGLLGLQLEYQPTSSLRPQALAWPCCFWPGWHGKGARGPWELVSCHFLLLE